MNTNQEPSKSWYNKKWLVVILCIFLFPIGLYALWKSDVFSKSWQIGITAIIGALIILNFANKGAKTRTQNTKESKVESIKLTPEESKNKQIEQTISARDLYEKYEENEIKADEIFKSKRFYVQGRVTTIANDLMDNPYVTLSTTNDFMSVQCSFEDKKVVSELHKGDQITVLGTCDGKLMNVLMDDCILAENYPIK